MARLGLRYRVLLPIMPVSRYTGRNWVGLFEVDQASILGSEDWADDESKIPIQMLYKCNITAEKSPSTEGRTD